MGGAPRALLDTVQSLSSSYKVEVCSYGAGPFVDACRLRGITCHVLPARLASSFPMAYWYLFLGALQWAWHLWKFAPDLCYVNTCAHSHPLLVARTAGVRTILHQREHFLKGRYRYRSRLRMKVFGFTVTDWWSVSSAVSQSIRSHFPRRRWVLTVHDALLASRAEELRRPLDARKARQQLGLELDGFLVGFLGAPTRTKGVDLFLRAATQLRGHPIRFAIAGGDYRSSFEMARVLELEKKVDLSRIHYFPQISKVRDFLSALDFLCVLSRSEGFGLVFLEAAAAGCPVLTTPVGAATEIFEEGKTGAFFPDYKVENIAKWILEFLSDSSRRENLAIGAKKTIPERFSWENYERFAKARISWLINML